MPRLCKLCVCPHLFVRKYLCHYSQFAREERGVYVAVFPRVISWHVVIPKLERSSVRHQNYAIFKNTSKHPMPALPVQHAFFTFICLFCLSGDKLRHMDMFATTLV